MNTSAVYIHFDFSAASAALFNNSVVGDYLLSHEFESIVLCTIKPNAHMVGRQSKRTVILLTSEDITMR